MNDFETRCIVLLKKLEWSSLYSHCTGWPCCPICGGIKPGTGRDNHGNYPENSGHFKGCALFDALNTEIKLND